MKLFGTSLMVMLAMLTFPWSADSQTKTSSLTFDVNVAARPTRVAGSLSDHVLTFNVPIEVPGASLPAGTYIFRSLTRSVIQVVSADRRTIYAAFQTTPSYRTTAREIVTFAAGGDTEALRIIGWYPPDSTGWEPIYPRSSNKSVERPR